MKSLSLVFKTTETPGFLFKFWEVLLILPRFSFCVYFGCSPRILILAVILICSFGRALSLILTPGRSPGFNYLHTKKYLFTSTNGTSKLQLPTALSPLSCPRDLIFSLKFSLLAPSLLFFITVPEHHH